MQKVSNCFADSELFPIFAPAILEKASGNALFDILHGRQRIGDLIDYGKFVAYESRPRIKSKNLKV